MSFMSLLRPWNIGIKADHLGICSSILVDMTCLKFILKSFADNDSNMSLVMEV